MAALAGGIRCVCELQLAAGVTAPALSHHLKVLRAALPVTAATDTGTAGCCARPAAVTAVGPGHQEAMRG